MGSTYSTEMLPFVRLILTKITKLINSTEPGIFKFPKQYPAVPATTWAPLPAACTSLILPPVPVVAPGKGATATKSDK